VNPISFILIIVGIAAFAAIQVRLFRVYSAKGRQATEANGGKHPRSWWLSIVAVIVCLVALITLLLH
jgi:uncharacterized membrane protein YidH (DUF202 family)